jgi:manganese transport protein
VAEGFLDLKLPIWLRRMVTRLLAIIPAVIVVGIAGDSGATKLLVLSQVVLSLQLPFAVVPLVSFTSDSRQMGALVNPLWLKIAAWAITATVIGLNATLLFSFL